MVAKIDMYLRFVYEDGKVVYTSISFDQELSEEQKDEFAARFAELGSCFYVDFEGNGLIITPLSDGEPGFISEVKACARKHYNVKRVTHGRK